MKKYIHLSLFCALFFANPSFAKPYSDSAEAAFHIDDIFYNDRALEGFSVQIKTQVTLDTLVGDPLTNSVVSWDFIRDSNNEININFIPYGLSNIVTMKINPDIFKNIYPFNMELQVYLGNHMYYSYDPGLVAEVPNKQSLNIPSGHDWDNFLQTVSGSYFGAKENKYFYNNSIKQNGLSISNLTLNRLNFNLIEFKTWHAKQVNTSVINITSGFQKAFQDELGIEVTLEAVRSQLKHYNAEDIINLYNIYTRKVKALQEKSPESAHKMFELHKLCMNMVNQIIDYYLTEEEISRFEQYESTPLKRAKKGRKGHFDKLAKQKQDKISEKKVKTVSSDEPRDDVQKYCSSAVDEEAKALCYIKRTLEQATKNAAKKYTARMTKACELRIEYRESGTYVTGVFDLRNSLLKFNFINNGSILKVNKKVIGTSGKVERKKQMDFPNVNTDKILGQISILQKSCN